MLDGSSHAKSHVISANGRTHFVGNDLKADLRNVALNFLANMLLLLVCSDLSTELARIDQLRIF